MSKTGTGTFCGSRVFAELERSLSVKRVSRHVVASSLIRGGGGHEATIDQT
jgi:hypothetical protein